MQDIRLSGFANRAPMTEAWAWMDGLAMVSRTEVVTLAKAAGRILTEKVVIGSEASKGPRAAENGYALRAADCDGASAYNPLALVLREAGADALPAGSAAPIATGWSLPAGADAVLPFEAAQSGGARSLEVLAPVAVGAGMERRLPVTLSPGRRLRPQDVACLASAGFGGVSVLRQPRVGILVPGSKFGADALTPLLTALLARDGALVEPIAAKGADDGALSGALACVMGCDLVLMAGRSGAGVDDISALAVHAAGGTLALHGIALRPGGSAGLGMLSGDVPIVLLPGEPGACLVAYDMLAARFVRRLAGLGMTVYAVGEFGLSRKIVSGIGSVEVVPVVLTGDQAQPIGGDSGLAGALQADGFVVVPDSSEGYPSGSRVRVHLYGT